MTAPFLLLGAAILFRGWFAGPLLPATIVAVALEAPRFIPWRVEVSRRQFELIWNFCGVLFTAMTVYFIFTNASTAVTAVVQWAPLCLLPMMAAIAYSSAGGVDLDMLSLVARNRVRREGTSGRRSVRLDYPFLLLCLLSASTAAGRTPWFYAGCVAFAAWSLLGVRSRNVSAVTWLAMLACASALGYAGHKGLHSLQGVIAQSVTDWYSRDRSDEGETDQKFSAIGSVGSRKLSNRIKLRVDIPEPLHAPMLLREAAYSQYRSQIWFAPSSPNEQVPRTGNDTWLLGADQARGPSVTIHASLGEGEKLLPLPLRAARIEGLPAVRMVRGPLGSIRISDGPDWADFRVFTGTAEQPGERPSPEDTAIPKTEAALLREMARDLGLTPEDPRRSMETLASFFRDRFQYSLAPSSDQEVMPLATFLRRTRAGHCEYFATATVLLLRAAGIPARYAVGYSVQEYSTLEKAFVVRARHAHAWCLVYADGAWRDLDTTPPSWSTSEDTSFAATSYVLDIWQRGVYLFSHWKAGFTGSRVRPAIAWGLGSILLVIAWNLYRKKRVRRTGPKHGAEPRPRPGSDSGFYAVEAALRKRGFLRRPWEPAGPWTRSILRQRVFSAEQETLLETIGALHDRYRFDPNGISSEERALLNASATAWLEAERRAGMEREQRA